MVAGHNETERVDVHLIMKTGLTAAVFGLVFGWGAMYFLVNDPLKAHLAVAFSGIVSFSGMAGLDAARKRLLGLGMKKLGDSDDK